MWWRRDREGRKAPDGALLRQLGWIGIGSVMLTLFAVGLWNGLPDRTARERLEKGVLAFEAGDYRSAEKNLISALRAEPRGVHARFGLACTFFMMGKKSRAALELTEALRHGLPFDLTNRCGTDEDDVELDKYFLVAKFGLVGAFAVPRIEGAERFESLLTSEPATTTSDEVFRFLIGACLSLRAGLDGVGWYYAANAVEVARPSGQVENLFLNCLGRETLTRLGCISGSGLECILSEQLREAYLRDRAPSSSSR